MGYRTLVQQQIDFAFRAVGDLALEVVLTNKTAVDYDFDADEPVYDPETTLISKAVLLEEKGGKTSMSNSVKAVILMKASDIANPDLYDTVLMSGVTWTIAPHTKGKPAYKGNGFTIEIQLVRSS